MPSQFGKMPWYRHVCAIGGVLNILMMMTANLVGFVIGVHGIKHLIQQLTESWDGLLSHRMIKPLIDLASILGIRFTIAACACIFVAVQVMFEYRQACSFADKIALTDRTSTHAERRKCVTAFSGSAELVFGLILHFHKFWSHSSSSVSMSCRH
jgi:hypothetical protein